MVTSALEYDLLQHAQPACRVIKLQNIKITGNIWSHVIAFHTHSQSCQTMI